MKLLNLVGTIGAVVAPNNAPTHVISKINQETQYREFYQSLNKNGYELSDIGFKKLIENVQKSGLTLNLSSEKIQEISKTVEAINYLTELNSSLNKTSDRMWESWVDYAVRFMEFVSGFM